MRKRNRYTKEFLEPIVNSSKTWREVCEKVSVDPLTGAQSHIQRVAKKLGINCNHFAGIGWAKGKSLNKKPIQHYLVKNGPIISSAKLRARLIREGLKPNHCEACGIFRWQGEEAPLELDHINEDHFDNRLENLMILCGNCHTLKTRKYGPMVERQTRTA